MRLKQPFSLPLLKTFGYYMSYQLVLWLIHMIFISFISFFHFLLDHRLSVIEEWAFENSWQLAIFAKLLASFVSLKFILVKSDLRVFRNAWESSFRMWRAPYYIYASVIFLFLFLMWSGNPALVPNREFSFINSAAAWVGTFIFYGSDLLILFFLRHFYCLRRGDLFLTSILATFVFYWSSKIVFIYTKDVNLFVAFSFLLLYFLSVIEQKRFVYPIIFMLGFVCPFSAFFGIDLLWGNSRSFLQMAKGIPFSAQFISFMIVVNYISIKRIGMRSYIRYLRLLSWKIGRRTMLRKGA